MASSCRVDLAHQQSPLLLKPDSPKPPALRQLIQQNFLIPSCLLLSMKPVAFFRAWKRKGKDKNTTKGKQDVSTTKRVVLAPESAPCTPTATSFEIPTTLSPLSLDHQVRSQSQDAIAFDPSSAYPQKRSSRLCSSTSSLVDQEVTTSSSPYPGQHGISHSLRSPIIWKSSHGPPKNVFHGPPSLNLYSPISGATPRSTGGTPPVRPPRPPPLNLYPTTAKRSVNTVIPPCFMADRAITFALPPNPRAIKSVELTAMTSGSPSDSPTLSGDQKEYISQSLKETIHCTCAAISPDGNYVYPHRDILCGEHAAVNLPRTLRFDALPASPPRLAQEAPDFSDTLVPQRVYQSGQYTSSTPYLASQDKQEAPLPPPLSSNSSNRQADDVSNFPLSLFPSPPPSPLFIRRKIAKTFVLRPSCSSSDNSLPLLPSPEYTPLVTPTTPRFQLSPKHPKSCSSPPRHVLPRTIPRSPFDPPSTPLPTPPMSPAPPGVTGTSSSLPSKSLRPVQSVNQLCSEQLLPPIMLPLHRATSSDPPSQPDGMTSVNQTPRRAQSRPEAIYLVSEIKRRLQVSVSDQRLNCRWMIEVN
jgi:hypothetical protein